MEILAGLTEGIISNALYDVVKRILKNDPIRSAIDQAFDELIQEKPNDFFVIEEIDRNRKHIFNNINLTEEATFVKILIDNNVLPETASRLYKKFSKKYKENIKEAALKEPEIFYPYAIREFENIKTDNKELIILLTEFAHKNEFSFDIIIKYFKDLEKIPNIPDIQSILRKDETKEGEFFRKEPAWVDYEQGFIVERKEVDEIIEKLENNTVQLVLGALASGKSIILKNVAFKLANENKKVYVVELKKHPGDDIKLFFENIPKIDDNSIFIVDDAYLYLSNCERLIRNFRSNEKGKLIIGSRVTKEITEGDPTVYSEFEHLSKTAIHIQAEDVTEEMIKIFLKARYHFNDDRIKTVSDNLKKYKKDLWFLSWALKAYDSKTDSVEENKIYKKIKNEIRRINADDVFLPLSVFYRFEIPIERKFLEKQLGIEERTINQLIKMSEILETEDVGKPFILTLHHSSLAELYFNTYINYPSLGEELKEKILNQKDDLHYCLFYKYMITYPTKAVDVAIYLGKDWRDKKGGKTLLENLIEDYKIQKSIVKEIEKEEDIKKVGSCVWGIARASEEVALKLVNSIDINALSSKINKEEDIRNAESCISAIAKVSEEVSLKLVNSIDINALSSKINKEENLGKIGSIISGIAKASKEAALKLVDSIDINALTFKIDKEESIGEAGWSVSNIAHASKEEVAMKLVDSISAKIDKEEDVVKVGECASYIAWANKEAALKLMDSVSGKIDKEEDIDKIDTCISMIAMENNEVGLKLTKNIDIDALSSKINKEENIEKIRYLLATIAKTDIKTLINIVNRLNPKLREELKKENTLAINQLLYP